MEKKNLLIKQYESQIFELRREYDNKLIESSKQVKEL
jgi:hypothetical protein